MVILFYCTRQMILWAINIIKSILVASLVNGPGREVSSCINCMAHFLLRSSRLLHLKFLWRNIFHWFLTISPWISSNRLSDLITAPSLHRCSSSTSSISSDICPISLNRTPSSSWKCMSHTVIRIVLHIILHEW